MAVRVLQQAAAEHLADLAYLVTRLTADPQAARFAPGVEAASAGLQAQPISIMGFGVRRTGPAPRRPPCPLWAGPGQDYGVLLWMEAGF